MKVKELVEILGPLDPDSEIEAVDIYLTANGEEAVDVIYK